MGGASFAPCACVHPACLPSLCRYEIDKLTASQRLDLNLEKGRMRDELQVTVIALVVVRRVLAGGSAGGAGTW